MKLTNSKKLIGGVALSGALMLTGIVGFAQQSTTQGQGEGDRAGRHGHRGGGKGMGGMRGGFGGGFMRNLNLTDAQKQQMGQISARYQESMKALRQQSGDDKRGGDFDAFAGGTFDEAAVRTAAQQRANAHVEMEVMRARMMSEMYNILTPEQKTQLAAERQQREQRRQERRGADAGQQRQ